MRCKHILDGSKRDPDFETKCHPHINFNKIAGKT